MRKQKRTEYAVGEKIERCGIIYEVREGETCRGCAFLLPTEMICTDSYRNTMGNCGDVTRKDGKSVIFINVGERED